MTQDELLGYTRRVPFQPFRMVLTTGRTFEIRHPDHVLVTRRSAHIGIPRTPDSDRAVSAFLADLLHVVGVEELETPAPSGGNGNA